MTMSSSSYRMSRGISSATMSGITLSGTVSLTAKYRYYILLASLLCFPLKECGWGDMLFPFSLAGCIFGLAFSMSFLNKFGKIGDLSYGTFLYHAPIIQFFTAMGWNDENRLSIIMVITYILAFCSWHLMEKKILKRG